MSDTGTPGHQQGSRSPQRKPPATSVGVLGWLHANLFNGWFNTLLTVLSLYLLWTVVPPLFDWLFFDAIWANVPAEVCRESRGSGACWAFIRDRYRLILFGTYPFEEQWRPLVGVIVLLAVIAFSCFRRFWRPWLALVWLGALLVYLMLLGGGVFGLSSVRTDLWGGLPLTLLLAVVGIVVAFPLSLLLALGRRAEHMPIVKAICVGYIELIRGVPLISLLFMASFMLPLFMPTGVTIDALIRAQVAIIVFVSSYLSEVIRGGLQALPRGQYEAAQAMGLTYWQMQRKIILPQAIKISIPPIVNTYLGMFKDTSLVAIVSLTDLLLATRQSFADPEWRPFFVEGYVFIACIYWSFCFFMSKYSQYLERALSTDHTR
ncbi:amino acid ABC transporter permease [Rhodovibrio salinarum]|uniref:Amino acid ABC transporter permease n=2 Tax=Rhodovibrio salinarum TaxID=1087 RepID=A0A934QL37_9PROT|nr:amino acid ABC transporter permease [Rhodovibrio salinarum]